MICTSEDAGIDKRIDKMKYIDDKIKGGAHTEESMNVEKKKDKGFLKAFISKLRAAFAVCASLFRGLVSLIARFVRPVTVRIKKVYNSEKLSGFRNFVTVIAGMIKRMGAFLKRCEEHSIAFTVVLGIVLNLVVEILSRRSLISGVGYMISHPALFAYNTLIVIVTLALALLFKKKDFVYFAVSAVWLVLGVANCVLLGFRTTPLNAMDFRTLKNVISIFTVYFSAKQIAFMGIGLAALICIVVFVFVKSPKRKKNPIRGAVSMAVMCAALAIFTSFSVNTGSLATTFHNIQDAYKDYGFAYCFACSVVDRGISKPSDYSKESIESIVESLSEDDDSTTDDSSSADLQEGQNEDADLDSDAVAASAQNASAGKIDGTDAADTQNASAGKIDGTDAKKIEAAAKEAGVDAEVVKSDKATEETPNVIMLQMESFFDVKYLKGVTFSEDPVPVFTSLKENYTSGWLTTPSFGAGTANTEFEVLSGMSIEYFGPGEYPFTTIMRETTSESVAYDLKDYGYSTHAIHDHTGKFYGRYLVYPNLGFDSYTSVEYMNNVERNPLNWADDSCLTGEITKAMNSTKEQDFVFAVSVQGHGKYPTEVIDPDQTITVQGFNEEEATGFEYYVNQIHDMDAFLGELTAELEASDEPTVLVIYGDHLPKFSIEASDLENGNIYQTEYVMWNNFGLEKNDKDLKTYQLYSYVMDCLGMDNGVITKLHQNKSDSDDYYSSLYRLQYDILYGNCYAYGGSKPFETVDMQMGIDPISITDITAVGTKLYVKGENFTAGSKIFINGKQVKTTFLNPGRIEANCGQKIDDGDEIAVVQMSSQKTHLSTTDTWIWHADGIELKPAEEDEKWDLMDDDRKLTDKELEEDIKIDAGE